MTAVYKKELRSYLYSVTGSIFVGANLLFLGIYYTAFNLGGGYPSIAYAINSAVFIFLLITPIITMRIMSEEQKQKTDQLLLTSPTSIMQIVLGKYFAMLTIFLIPVAVTCLYPLILGVFGKVAYGESYTAVLGYFIFGAACIAVGLFISSLTDNQIIAAVLTFAVMLLSFLMQGIESLISESGNFLTKIMSAFDFGSRLNNMMQGVIDFGDIIYFVSVIILMLFLTYESVQKRRFAISSATIKLSAYNSTVIVFAVAIAVIVNLLAGQIPETYSQIDTTKNGLYTVSKESKQYLDTVSADVTIYCMSKKENMDTKVEKTLSEYENACSRIKVKYIDPSLNPTFASQYTSDDVSDGSLIVVSGDKSKVVSNSDLYESSVDYSTYQQTTTGYDGEGQITSAISYVTSPKNTTIYMVSGHGEYSMTDLTKLDEALKKANIDVKSVNLMDMDTVSGCDILMIMSPSSDYTKDDAAKVLDYLKAGGKAIIASSYVENGTSMDNFNTIMQYYGCNLAKGLVLDTDMGRYYSNNPMYLLPNVESNTLTSTITADNRYVFAPYSQGITVSADSLRDTLEVTPLLTTSASSYSKTDVESENAKVEKENGDVAGPFDIGVYAVEGDTKIAYFSCATMFTDNAYQVVGDSNNQLITNAIGDMVTTPIGPSIPVKEYDLTTIAVSKAFTLIYGALFALILPIALIVVGIVLWARRRHK